MNWKWPIRILVVAGGIAGSIGALLLIRPNIFTELVFAPNQSPAQHGTLPFAQRAQQADIETVAENLETPWEIAFLPDSTMLVTERPGRLVKIGKDHTVIPIEGVTHVGEGGLLGLALHPNFSRNHFIYLYLTTRVGGALQNRVERYTLTNATLTNRVVILENIPGSSFHDGGRIAFGPDKKLYITVGDAEVSKNAQDTNSISGKILRINDDGSIPSDNPFQSAVYSYGHRNPQGITWDSAGNLWATEHGRSGAASGFDEINLITPGANYGWPTIQGDQTRAGMQSPKAHSGSSTTWAPSGAVFFGNTMLFAGLRGQSLYAASIQDTTVEKVTPFFTQQFGRLRTVTVGPDGFLYVLTNNRDGRGTPKEHDDKIIRINPRALGLTK